jgi:hypothetical protein
MKTISNYSCKYFFILAAIILFGCGEKPKKEINIVKKEYKLPHKVYLDIIETKGHEYMIVSASRSGVSIIHSEACPCKKY